jgi:hypothetical protein
MASTPPTDPALPAKLLAGVSQLVGRRTLTQNEYQNWWSGPPTGGPNGDGLYPSTDPAGNVTFNKSPKRIVADLGVAHLGPEAFGAIGDGLSHPASNVFPTLAACQAVYPKATSLAQEIDMLAWQKMVDTRGVYQCPTGCNYKMCNSDPESWPPLSWCAGLSDVDGAYGRMDWTDLRAQQSDQHFVDNFNFATPSGWFNSTDYDDRPGWIIYATFDQGYASCIDDKDVVGDRNPYYEFKHEVTLPPGRWRAIMRATATRGISYHYANGNPPYCTIHLNGIADRSATVFPALDAADPENVEVPVSAQFDFETTAASSTGNIVFKGGGYVDLKVLSYDIIPFEPNCAILNHRDGPIDHYFTSRRLRNILIQGPYADVDNAGLACGLWKSFASIDGSLQDWDGIKIFGFDKPLEWSDGAYLINYYGCDMESRGQGCYFGPGNVNAGENIKFYWGSVSGGKCAFTNIGGAEITLFGTIVDYNEQLCSQNSGKIRLLGTRHEQHIPTDPLKPIWHCTTGRVIYDDSYVLLAGGIGESPCPPAKLDTHSATIEFHATEVYNLSSAAGVGSSGPGRLNFYGWLNNGNPNIGPDLLSESLSMDLLGGGGRFEQQRTGADAFLHQETNGIDLVGGINASDPAGRMLDRWNSTFIKTAVVADRCRTGTRSLKVTKLKGVDNNVYSQLNIYVPLPSPGNLLGRMYLCFPDAVTDPDVLASIPVDAKTGEPVGWPVYFRQFYVQVLRHDVLGRPIVSARNQFKGEEDFYLQPEGDPAWIRRSLNTTYGQPTPSDVSNERSPAWATHYMIAIDFQNMPAMSFYIDDLQINHLG